MGGQVDLDLWLEEVTVVFHILKDFMITSSATAFHRLKRQNRPTIVLLKIVTSLSSLFKVPRSTRAGWKNPQNLVEQVICSIHVVRCNKENHPRPSDTDEKPEVPVHSS